MITIFFFIRFMVKTVFLSKLGKTITRLRKEAGLSQVELAQRCGRSKQNINRIEKGGHNPSIYVLHEIAEVLKVPVREFLDFE